MIIYDLECRMGHRFEGWFPSPDEFEKQKSLHLIMCAVCGMDEIEKIPSGAHVGVNLNAQPVKKPVPTTSNNELMTNQDPVTLLKMVDHFVKTHFKDVGKEFAKKALEIHRGEAPKEGIFGSSTPKEREALEEEGVPFSMIPRLPESTEN